jgi:hypothetical protein
MRTGDALRLRDWLEAEKDWLLEERPNSKFVAERARESLGLPVTEYYIYQLRPLLSFKWDAAKRAREERSYPTNMELGVRVIELEKAVKRLEKAVNGQFHRTNHPPIQE